MTEQAVEERNREKLSADFISPLVLYLCSEQCRLNHEMFAVGGGTVARTILALAPGWRVHSKAEFTAEAIQSHLEEIMDMTNYSNPQTTQEETLSGGAAPKVSVSDLPKRALSLHTQTTRVAI
jgi:hypothetical protein